MADWDGRTERRAENQAMMSLLNNMDKNLALAVQRLEAQGLTLDKHIIDDKKVQDELKDGQTKINEKLAKWIGGSAVVMAICMSILNRIIETVWH